MKSNKSRIIAIILLVAILCLAMTGCVPHNTPSGDPAGFFTGIWNGWIAPFTLIASMFSDVRMYEINNTGFFYELGFYMAIISGFGGLAFSRRRNRN